MAIPSADDTSATVLRSARFTLSRTRANPKTQPLAKGAAEALARLLAAIDKRNEADDALLEAEAAHDFVLETLEDELERFEGRIIGIDQKKDGPHFQAIFQKARSAIVASPKADHLQVFGRIIERAQDAERPAEVRRAVKDYAAAYRQFQVSSTSVAAAGLALAKAEERERAAKMAVIVAMTRLQGKLLDLFAESRTRVARFFLKGPKPKKAKKGEKGEKKKEETKEPPPAK